MYERNAIVLERYFEKLFGFNKEHNLKENHRNYIKLIEDTKQYIDIVEQEEEIIKSFDEVANEIGNIQRKHEKVNTELVRLQEARNELFNEISENPEELEEKMLKVENVTAEYNEKEIELRKQYIENLAIFIDKQAKRTAYDRNKRVIEKTHMELLKETISNFDKINIEDVEKLQKFITKDIKENLEELKEIILKNGKQERVPFDESVIEVAIKARLEIAKKEAELYVNVYDKARRLLTVLESGNLKLGRSEKIVRDTGVKLGFLSLEKEYIFSFLDYERMAIMNGETEHKNLMKEATENFENDIKQIENLYELIDRETVSKGTKKAYKELYNADYLQQIENKEKKFENKIESSKIRKTSVINSNFWRIEGIKNIYYLFQEEVTEKLGKDLSEYGIIEEKEEANNKEIESENKESKYEKIFGKKSIKDSDLEFEEQEKNKSVEETNKEKAKKIELIEDDFSDEEDDKYKNDKYADEEDYDNDEEELKEKNKIKSKKKQKNIEEKDDDIETEEKNEDYIEEDDDEEDYEEYDDDDDFVFDDEEDEDDDDEDDDYDDDEEEKDYDDDDDDFIFDDDDEDDDDEDDFIEEDYDDDDDDFYDDDDNDEYIDNKKVYDDSEIIIEHNEKKRIKEKNDNSSSKRGKRAAKDKGLMNKLFKK